MNNFELFEKALEKCSKGKNTASSQEKCTHDNIIFENGTKLCEDCGIEINRDICYDKEWRYYGAADTRHNTDPNRCYIRKSEERTIYKDVDNMGFSDKIVSKANKLYEEVTSGKIYRGNSRKAIIFACIFSFI